MHYYFDDQYDPEEESSGDGGNRGDSGPKGYEGAGDQSGGQGGGGSTRWGRTKDRVKKGAQKVKKGAQKARQWAQRGRQGAEAARTATQAGSAASGAAAGGGAAVTGGAGAAGAGAAAGGGAAVAGGAGAAGAGAAGTAVAGGAAAGGTVASGGTAALVAAGAYAGKKGIGAAKEAVKNPSSILTIPQRGLGWAKAKAQTAAKWGLRIGIIFGSFFLFMIFFIASFTAMEMIADKAAQASDSFNDTSISIIGPTEGVGGQILQYTITATSTKSVLGLIVKHELSPNVEYISSQTTGFPVYNPTTRTVTWSTQFASNPANATYTLTVRVAPALKDVYIINIVRVFPVL